VLPLADAVRRMSGLPAATLGLSGRGVLREGAYADPHQLSAGVSEVLVNGKVTISGGTFTGELAGRALAGPGARR
jgi:N-acyl-D-amino-acid deacylase